MTVDLSMSMADSVPLQLTVRLITMKTLLENTYDDRGSLCLGLAHLDSIIVEGFVR